MTETLYESVCLRLLEAEDFEESERWCERLATQYPDCLAAYTCRLKLGRRVHLHGWCSSSPGANPCSY